MIVSSDSNMLKAIKECVEERDMFVHEGMETMNASIKHDALRESQ